MLLHHYRKTPHLECPHCGHVQISIGQRKKILSPTSVRQTCQNCGTRYRDPHWYMAIKYALSLLTILSSCFLITLWEKHFFLCFAALLLLWMTLDTLLGFLSRFAPFIVDTSASKLEPHSALRPLRELAKYLQQNDIPGFRDYQETPHLACPCCGHIQVSLSSRLQLRHHRIQRETCQNCGANYRNSTRYEFSNFVLTVFPLIGLIFLFADLHNRFPLWIILAIIFTITLALRHTLLLLLTYLSPFVIDKD